MHMDLLMPLIVKVATQEHTTTKLKAKFRPIVYTVIMENTTLKLHNRVVQTVELDALTIKEAGL